MPQATSGIPSPAPQDYAQVSWWRWSCDSVFGAFLLCRTPRLGSQESKCNSFTFVSRCLVSSLVMPGFFWIISFTKVTGLRPDSQGSTFWDWHIVLWLLIMYDEQEHCKTRNIVFLSQHSPEVLTLFLWKFRVGYLEVTLYTVRSSDHFLSY